MKRLSLIVAWLLASAPAAGPAGAPPPAATAGAHPVRVPIIEHPSLILQVPDDWKVASLAGRIDIPPPMLRFDPVSGPGRFNIRLTIDPLPAGAPKIAGPGELRHAIERSRDGVVAFATTRDIPVLELKGKTIHGYYYTWQYKPEAGKGEEWRCTTSGMAFIEEQIVTFLIGVSDMKQPEIARAVAMLESADWEKPR